MAETQQHTVAAANSSLQASELTQMIQENPDYAALAYASDMKAHHAAILRLLQNAQEPSSNSRRSGSESVRKTTATSTPASLSPQSSTDSSAAIGHD